MALRLVKSSTSRFTPSKGSLAVNLNKANQACISIDIVGQLRLLEPLQRYWIPALTQSDQF